MLQIMNIKRIQKLWKNNFKKSEIEKKIEKNYKSEKKTKKYRKVKEKLLKRQNGNYTKRE